MSATDQTPEFLDALYGSKLPEAGSIMVFTVVRPGVTRFYWADTAREAYERVAGLGDEADIYISVGLFDRALVRGGRGTAEHVLGLVGFVADLDYGEVGHKPSSKDKAKRMPRTPEDALALIPLLPYPPTMIVHSGHGFHLWWLFNRPWMFDSPEERTRAAEWSHNWHLMIKAIITERGFTTDSVFDLPRVMRCAGTVNCKADPNGHPRSYIHSYDADQRYQPDQFAPRVLSDRVVHSAERPAPVLGVPGAPDADDMRPEDDELKAACRALVIDPEAWPPGKKFDALKKIKRFRDSFERKAKANQEDNTASGHDFALAVFAAQYDWTPQEACDLILAARHENGDEPKTKYYYARTVEFAYRRVISDRARDNLVTVDAEADMSDTPVSPAERRALKLKYLSDTLLIKVVRMVRYLGSAPQFQIFTEHGQVLLGDATAIIEQPRFCKLLAGTTLHRIPTFKATDWANISQALLSACEDVERGDDAYIEGVMRSWVEMYLLAKSPGTPAECLGNYLPFVDQDGVYVMLSHFQSWLRQTVGVNLDTGELSTRMAIYGAKLKRYPSHQDNGKPTSISTYRLPLDPTPYLDGRAPALPEITNITV